MLSRFSPGRPQFIPSAAGHSELDPRSRSRGGYCSPAEQKRKGSGGETQQSRAPKRRAPPSIHHSGGTEPAAFQGRKQRSRGRRDKGAREPTLPLPSPSPPGHPRPQPPATLAPSPLCPPNPPQGAGAAAGEPGGLRSLASPSVGSEKKEKSFQCLIESSLVNLWCLSGG